MTNNISTEAILNSIEDVIGKSTFEKPIQLHEPDFRGTNAWHYVKDCLDSGWVSTAGQWVKRFEKELCDITKAKNAIAVSNGTVALRLALHLVGVEPGDEVLLPPLSFVATANAIAHLGAIPHFIDIEATTLGLDPNAVAMRLDRIAEYREGRVINRETGRRIRAMVLVHVFGHPANAPALSAIANQWNLPLIEDAAEALGSWRNHCGEETHCGLFGDIGTLSFNGNKLITTGGGGALITNNSELAERAHHLSTTAKKNHPWEFVHDCVGWNDRLPNINAALGVAQLEILNKKLSTKRRLMDQYLEAFDALDNLELLKEPLHCKSNYWLVTLRFCSEDSFLAETERIKLLKESHKRGLLLRPAWKLLNKLPMYQNNPSGPLKVALDQDNRLVNLPSSTILLEA